MHLLKQTQLKQLPNRFEIKSLSFLMNVLSVVTDIVVNGGFRRKAFGSTS